MSRLYQTRKVKEIPPYGAFDDLIIFQVEDDWESFVMRKYEFDWLAHKLFDNWQLKRNSYIQILREWNECIGFQAIPSKASLIQDMRETYQALKLIELPNEALYDQLEKEDFEQLLHFFNRNKEKKVEIRER